MPGALPPPFLAITPGVLERDAGGGFTQTHDAMLRAARAAIAGGVRGLLVREPSLADGDVLRLARALREALDEVDEPTWLGLHDRVHLASAAGAQAAHVGGRSLPAAEARRVLDAGLTLGVSTHDGDDRGAWEGADYALHAPVFTPVSKHASGAALGHDGLARFVERCGLPVWAVGGITSERIGELASTGARGAAAIGAVWGIDATDAVGIETRAAALGEAAGHVFSEVPQ